MWYRALSGALVYLLAASASAAVVPVTPNNLAGWQLPGGPPTCGGPGSSTGAFTFTPGPGSPPLGSGSLTFTIGADPASFLVGTNHTSFAGVRLSDITEMRYSTFVSSAVSHATSQQAPRLFLSLNLGDGGFHQIIFVPRLQTGTHPGDVVPNEGPVVLGAWQTWDALAGGWWDFTGLPSNPPLVRLSTIAAAHPNATIAGDSFSPGLAILVGCESGDWTNFSGSVDDLKITVNGAVTEYNFEPATSIPVSEPSLLLLLAATLMAIAAARLRS